MLFVPFPSLPQSESIRFAEPIDLGKVNVAPSAALGAGLSLRLAQVARRPAYIVGNVQGPPSIIDAMTGAPHHELTPSQAEAVAARFPGAVLARAHGPVAYDQWIVHQQFDVGRPYYRVSLGDEAKTDIYVSARTGEAVQRTTANARFWNWPGAIIHWIYLTPLRKSFTAWDQTVWWVSLAGLLTALAGAYLGIYRSWRAAKQRRKLSPFRGWLRWHHILGLAGGLFVTTWIFSGWLSMDHGRLFSRGEASEAVSGAFKGIAFADAVRDMTLDDLRQLGSASRVDFGAIDGRAVAAGFGVGDPRVLLRGERVEVFERRLPDNVLIRAASASWPNSMPTKIDVVPANDFYGAAEGFPEGTVKLRMEGAKPFDLYIDAAHGSITTVMDGSRRAYAWVYFALHSFKIPGLIERPILWRSIVLIPLMLGFAFSVTSVVVALARIRHDLRN